MTNGSLTHSEGAQGPVYQIRMYLPLWQYAGTLSGNAKKVGDTCPVDAVEGIEDGFQKDGS